MPSGTEKETPHARTTNHVPGITIRAGDIKRVLGASSVYDSEPSVEKMVDRPHHYINHNVSEKIPRVMKSSTNLAGNITLVLYSHQGPNVDYIIGQSGGWYVSPIWWKMGQGLYSAAPVRGLRLERGTRRPIVTTASTMTNDNNSSNSNSNHQNNSPILRSTLLEQSSRQANTKKQIPPSSPPRAVARSWENVACALGWTHL